MTETAMNRVAAARARSTIQEKPSSDLVKIGQQIKVMLNNLINYKVASPVVGDILIEDK
jgi:hypothetical protein